MGQYLSLGILSEFSIENVEKAKDFARKIFEDMKSEDIPYDDIDKLGSYITTDYTINKREVILTFASDCDAWESVLVENGNLGLYINFYDSYVDFSEVEKSKNYLEKISKELKEKYGFDFYISMFGTFG